MAKKFWYAAGETIDAAVKESASYPEVRFTYEPPTIGQRAEYGNRIRATDDQAKLVKIAQEIIAKHVREWNVVKSDKAKVDPKNAGEMNRVVPDLVDAVSKVIYQGTQGDLPALDGKPDEEAEDVAGKNS